MIIMPLLSITLIFFLVKDQATKKVLLRGRCRVGMYPFPPSSPEPRRTALSVTKPSTAMWHSRLGHPSSIIVQRIIHDHNLPYSSDKNNESVCDACQQAKSHQLPYTLSFSQSHAPLELVHSDVLGPAIDSFGCKKYYASLTTIENSSVFTFFVTNPKCSNFSMSFNHLLKDCLIAKLLPCRLIGVANMKNSILFFCKVGSTHHVSFPYAHRQNGTAERKHRQGPSLSCCCLPYKSHAYQSS